KHISRLSHIQIKSPIRYSNPRLSITNKLIVSKIIHNISTRITNRIITIRMHRRVRIRCYHRIL
ncbi:hypothetical protein LINPERPRIM_LOCUS11435, partial [Linum perenne]